MVFVRLWLRERNPDSQGHLSPSDFVAFTLLYPHFVFCKFIPLLMNTDAYAETQSHV